MSEGAVATVAAASSSKMPSLRQKVTTYFRQLSFIAEPRDGPKSPRKTDEDGNFIIKYLEG